MWGVVGYWRDSTGLRDADGVKEWWSKAVEALEAHPCLEVHQGVLHLMVDGERPVMIDGQKSFMMDHAMAWTDLAGSEE